MKLSSRKQLLEEADDVLKDISKRRVDELNPEAQAARLQRKTGYSNIQVNLINWKLKKELALIERKYKDKNDPVSRQKEMDELIGFAEKLRKHVAEENYKEIPLDPEKQTEIQKIIMNTPPFPKGFDVLKNFAKTVVQDPETGMYWSTRTGTPELPPEWQKDELEYTMDSTSSLKYDYSRGWFYNLLRKLIIGTDLT